MHEHFLEKLWKELLEKCSDGFFKQLMTSSNFLIRNKTCLCKAIEICQYIRVRDMITTCSQMHRIHILECFVPYQAMRYLTHYVKSAHIRSSFRSVLYRIRTRKTPYLDTFHAVT